MKKKDYNKHTLNKGTLTEYNPTNLKDHSKVNWDVEESVVNSDPLYDEGTGKPVIIRMYEFKFPPTLKGVPSKEQILTKDYIKHLKLRLWADELEMILEPRVTIDKTGCKVFATCQAKQGSIIPYHVKTQRLQDITQPNPFK